jgi:hypothetical protein
MPLRYSLAWQASRRLLQKGICGALWVSPSPPNPPQGRGGEGELGAHENSKATACWIEVFYSHRPVGPGTPTPIGGPTRKSSEGMAYRSRARVACSASVYGVPSGARASARSMWRTSIGPAKRVHPERAARTGTISRIARRMTVSHFPASTLMMRKRTEAFPQPHYRSYDPSDLHPTERLCRLTVF